MVSHENLANKIISIVGPGAGLGVLTATEGKNRAPVYALNRQQCDRFKLRVRSPKQNLGEQNPHNSKARGFDW